MIVAWRIDKARHARTAFTGDGARRYGGRWNPRGVPVVYLSDSPALAALEKFVHLGKTAFTLRYVTFRVQIPRLLVEILPVSRLPSGWRRYPAPVETQDLGNAWAGRHKTAVLQVPSAIIPEQSNFLLNPLHPDARRIRISLPEPFRFDPRMIK